MIPEIIHYCWLSNDPVPQDLQRYMNTWISLFGYDFIKWDIEFFGENVPWVNEALENKMYAFACDYIRLYAVYKYGGIYMDMDMELHTDFKGLHDAQLMLAYEDTDRFKIEAGCFGAEPNNPIIGECLKHYEGRHFVKEDGTFDTTPLPDIMGEVIRKHPEVKVYTCDYFTAKSFRTGHIKTTENTRTIHHFAGSWLPEFDKEVAERTEKYAQKYGGSLPRYMAIGSYFKDKYGAVRAPGYMLKYALQKVRK